MGGLSAKTITGHQVFRTDSFNKEKAVFEHCEFSKGSLTALQITPLLSGKVEQVEHEV